MDGAEAVVFLALGPLAFDRARGGAQVPESVSGVPPAGKLVGNACKPSGAGILILLPCLESVVLGSLVIGGEVDGVADAYSATLKGTETWIRKDAGTRNESGCQRGLLKLVNGLGHDVVRDRGLLYELW